MKSIIILSLLFSICAKGKEIQNCDDCEEIIGEPIEQAISDSDEDLCDYCSSLVKTMLEFIYTNIIVLLYNQNNPAASLSIPDCEACDLWILSPIVLYDRACLAVVNGCHVQIAPITLNRSKLICDCELNTDKGKRKGGIHGIIENPKFSVITKSCSEEMGDTFFHEDGHVGADKLHLTCEGDEDFLKACEEEKQNYKVDNVVKAVAVTVANTFLNFDKGLSKAFDCRDYLTNS